MQEFRNLVADESNLFPSDPATMNEILAQYYTLWKEDRDPIYIVMCVEAIYEAF